MAGINLPLPGLLKGALNFVNVTSFNECIEIELESDLEEQEELFSFVFEELW